MENTQPAISTEDDVFSTRGPAKASSSRIHFPANSLGSNRSARTRPDGPSGLTPPVRRGSPLNPQISNQGIDPRRQPWPPDSTSSYPDPSSRHRRNPSFSQANASRLDSQPILTATQDNELEAGVFSDEYDLAHEDPRILQDVQRALIMKARREARLKRETALTPDKLLSNSSPGSQRSASSSISTGYIDSPTRRTTSSSYPQGSNRKASMSTSSDVDFSPATGTIDSPARTRPVPCSIDNGKTLDWSTSYSDDGDKRWSISIGKRKEKDKLPPLGAIADEQEQLHRLKLLELKRTASSQTIRKVDITSRQLGRRYALIYNSIETTQKALNLAKISRWHGSQPEAMKQSLEKAEPLTWLKHLEKRTTRTSRSRWHLSALIMEQYSSPQGLDRMQTIPENSTMLESALSFPRKARSPSFLSSSQGTSGHGVLSSPSTDDRISFEPLAEYKRDSLDVMSRRSGESVLSSIRSGSSASVRQSRSPISAHNESKDPQSTIPPRRFHSPGSSSSSSTSSVFSKPTEGLVSSLVVPGLSIHPPSSEQLIEPVVPSLTLNSSQGSSGSSQKGRNTLVTNDSVTSLKDASQSRDRRKIYPSSSKRTRHSKKYLESREERLRREYETKASILKETAAHNHRIRQFLNRISNGLRDYDFLQQASAATPGINQRSIPKDVLDTFSHDPSAVTGSTRRLRGWRAVEDIHQRVHRQRSILKTFINSSPEHNLQAACLLDEPIESIFRALSDVDMHREEIARGADEVANILASVEEEYAEVKNNYNKTVSRVSVQYPELSTLIALEESYRDQYQQFWDFGLDALTLLLDTVTPVWRTYGKTIGEDVRDFLIVPLYRNEFTGEAKPYPIKGFPRRTLRHWFGLGVFFLFSMAFNILQIRAAVTSVSNYRLQSIPYDSVRWTALPFFWVAIIIQWLAVVFEFAIVLLQLGVIAWWTGWSVRLLT